MPKPPVILGLQTFFQAMRHLAPEQVSSAAQKKDLRIASNLLIIFLGSLKTDMKWVARASRVDEMRVSLAPRDKSLAAQPERYFRKRWMIGSKAEDGRCVWERGRPR